VRAAVIVAPLLFVACSLTSLDGLSGGTAEIRPPADGGTAEASSSPGDGATSARLCGGPSFYCSTFDEGAPTEILSQNGSVRVDSATHVSPPNALVLLAEPTATAKANAQLSLRFRMGTRLRVAFAVNVLESTSGYTELFYFDRQNAPVAACQMYLVLNGDEWRIAAGCPYEGPARSLGSVRRGSWSQVVIAVDTATGRGSATIDSTTADFAMPATFGNGDVVLFAGIFYAPPGSNRTTIAIDDLFVGE